MGVRPTVVCSIHIVCRVDLICWAGNRAVNSLLFWQQTTVAGGV